MSANPSASAAAPLAGFLAKVLAPLSPDVEPVQTPIFLRDVRAAHRATWSRGMQRVSAARHERDAVDIRWCLSNEKLFSGSQFDKNRDLAWKALVAEIDRQMRIPAPTLGALRWKQKSRGANGGHPDWDRQIADDAARLGVVL